MELSEKAEEVEQADLEAKQAEFRENNPDVVADFRAKTEELFHSLDGQSADDIEKTVYAYVQSQIDEYGLDAEIVDVVIAGSVAGHGTGQFRLGCGGGIHRLNQRI